MAKGYCSILDVSLTMGKVSNGASTLSVDQQMFALNLIGETEAHIDTQTRRLRADGVGGWLVPALTNERYDLLSPVLLLRFVPIASVQSIQWRRRFIGDVLQTLTSGVEYELLDASRGEIQFQTGWHGRDAMAFVSYTPNRPVPADISQACAQIVAASLYAAINPDRVGVGQAQIGHQTQITYTESGLMLSIPAHAQQIIAAHRLPLIV